MRDGEVALAVLPQIDERAKSRPVVVLREMPRYGDVLVCGISTRLQERVPGFDEVISPQDTDFGPSGLLAPSLIRLGFLSVVPRRRIAGSIGAISPERYRRLVTTLCEYLAPRDRL
jgi:mRNA interferase MazF